MLNIVEVSVILNMLDDLWTSRSCNSVKECTSCIVDTEGSLIIAVDVKSSGEYVGVACIRSMNDDIVYEDMLQGFLQECLSYKEPKLFWFNKKEMLLLKSTYSDLSSECTYLPLLSLVDNAVKERENIDSVHKILLSRGDVGCKGGKVLVTSV